MVQAKMVALGSMQVEVRMAREIEARGVVQVMEWCRGGGGVQADGGDRTRAGGDGAGDTAGGREAGDGLDGAGWSGRQRS